MLTKVLLIVFYQGRNGRNMAYYDYECVRCHKQFEIQQHMADPVLEHFKHLDRYCCSCYGPVERKISVPTLKFVGKGFFVNDYPKDSTR